MRALLTRNGKAGLLGLGLLFSLVGGSYADTQFVKPGATDVLNWPFGIDSESVSDAAGVQVSVQVTPSNMAQYFVVDTANSVLGPVSITRGNSQTFTVKYTIAQNAPDGASFNVVLLATMTTPGALPTVGNIDDAGNILSAPMSFIGEEPSFLVGAQLRGVSQEAVREGLKFSAGSLLYSERRQEPAEQEEGSQCRSSG